MIEYVPVTLMNPVGSVNAPADRVAGLHDGNAGRVNVLPHRSPRGVGLDVALVHAGATGRCHGGVGEIVPTLLHPKQRLGRQRGPGDQQAASPHGEGDEYEDDPTR